MIFEMRTYDLHPGKVAEFEDGFGRAYERRQRFSRLAAFWHTEIGPLHQVIHVWPYGSVEERLRIRSEAVKDGHWPPPNSALIARMQSDIYLPVPGAPELVPGRHGPYFEICISTYRTATLARITEALGARSIAWYSEIGSLNKVLQIFPLRSLDERKAQPLPPDLLVCVESKVVMPSSFSPVQ